MENSGYDVNDSACNVSQDHPKANGFDNSYETCPCGAKCLQLDDNWILSEPVKKTSKNLMNNNCSASPQSPGTEARWNKTTVQKNSNVSLDLSNYMIRNEGNFTSAAKDLLSNHSSQKVVGASRDDEPLGYSNLAYKASSELSLRVNDAGDYFVDVYENETSQSVEKFNPMFEENIGPSVMKISKEMLQKGGDIRDQDLFYNDNLSSSIPSNYTQERSSNFNQNNNITVTNQNTENRVENNDVNETRAKSNGCADVEKSDLNGSMTTLSNIQPQNGKQVEVNGGASLSLGNTLEQEKKSIFCCFRKKNTQEVTLDEDEKWLRWVQKKFQEIAGEDGEIDLAEFKGALKVKKSFFAERFFSLFDQDNSGSIEMNELMDGLHMLTKGTPKQKLKFLFDVYDVDGSGQIDPDELKTVLKSCMDESSLSLSEEALDELTLTLFEAADEDCSGEITFEELVNELEKHPGVIENLTISAANWLRPPEKKKKSLRPRYLTWKYISNNLRKVIFLIVYLLINIGLFLVSAIRYRAFNWCVITARGCGMALNFNCAFVLVLMLRNCLTWLRSTKLGSFLPLDQSIFFHKMVGMMIAFLSTVHTLAHLGNLVYVVTDTESVPANTTAVKYWEYLFTLKGGIGWIGPGFGFLSGVILDVILAIMVVCSLPFVRRSGHFQVFYWTHMLYVAFWVFLILHGPIFWYFFIIPGTIFIIEKVMNSKLFKLARYGKVYVKEVNLLPSKVTHLVISRPENFHYKAGDYIFINIPKIAEYEWHPFTISSAPEMTGEFWLHVRSAGHWTNKLYEFFDGYDPLTIDDENIKINMENGGTLEKGVKFSNKRKSLNGETNKGFESDGIQAKAFNSLGVIKPQGSIRRDRKKDRHKRVKVQVFIDGPYGTATREIFETEHAVLIGSGIGVTPFASILQSVMYRYNIAKATCPKCDHTWFGQLPANIMKMKKLDFIWINRDQKAFEWFVSLLARLEMQQNIGNSDGESSFDTFLEMQMYMTSALKKSDMKGMALQLAMEMMHEKGGKDVVTGLKTRTQPGRPNWGELFKKLKEEKKGKIKVFFCGAPLLSKTLKEYCVKFGIDFAKENF